MAFFQTPLTVKAASPCCKSVCKHAATNYGMWLVFYTQSFLLSRFDQINDGIRHLLWFVLLQKVAALFDGVVG